MNSPKSAPEKGVSALPGKDPDNESLCKFEASSGPVSAYSVTPDYPHAGFSKCRLVVERDDYRTNSAAHLEITGASCQGLAVINIKGMAGYVQIAIAGDNLTDLMDALGRLIPMPP